MGDKEREKTEKDYNHQDALGTPTHPVSGPHNRKSCFHNAATDASARSAVPPQRGWQTEAGVTPIEGVPQNSAIAQSF